MDSLSLKNCVWIPVQKYNGCGTTSSSWRLPTGNMIMRLLWNFLLPVWPSLTARRSLLLSQRNPCMAWHWIKLYHHALLTIAARSIADAPSCHLLFSAMLVAGIDARQKSGGWTKYVGLCVLNCKLGLKLFSTVCYV